MVDPATLVRDRISAAIGGRDKALALEKASEGRFQRKRLQSWIDGATSPPVTELVALARFLGKADDYFFGERIAAEMVEVPKLDIRAAAGGGAINSLHKVEETLQFPRWMIDRLVGSKGRLALMRVHGDSMEPLIRNGALLLVDAADRDYSKPKKPLTPWHHTDIFVFLQGEDLRVKRLLVDPKGAIVAVSENPAYLPEVLRKQDFKMQGRVVWWDNFL